MRPNPLERRRWASVTRRPHFRPLIELLETRVVPSIVDHSAGFANHSDLTFNGSAVVNDSVAQLTTAANQAGSIFSNNKVEDFQFDLNFTFQIQGATTAAGGLTLTFTNTSPSALGGNGAGMGFSGLSNSLGFFFSPSTNTTGILISGQPGTSITLGNGINLQSQDLFSVSLTNNGSSITESIVDTSTGATFTTSFNVVIQQQIGSHTAFVGFTGGTGQHAATGSVHTFLGHFGTSVSPPLTASSAGTVNGVEGQSLHNVTVATFTGPTSSSGITAVISWGDGTTSNGFITGPDQNGVFTVTGAHTYVEEGNPAHGGPFVITVTITNGSSTVSVTDNTNIAEAPLAATGGFNVSLVEGQTVTGTVATFTDTGGPENATLDYSATISWGDGTVSAGAISGPAQNGVFTVSGSHTYADDGESESDIVDVFPITVTITHETVSATVTSFAFVSEEPEEVPTVVGGFSINAVEGQAFTAAVASFTDGNEPASEFTATISWGDGTVSQGTISGPDQNGVFTVIGSHTYAEDGENEADTVDVFPITVTITNSVSVSVSSTAFVSEEAEIISAQGGFSYSTTEYQPLSNITVATFTTEPGESIGEFTATIDWGDGTTSTGTISGPDQNGVFTVTGTHTYSELGGPGPDLENEQDAVDVFAINVTISDDTSVTVTSIASVAEEAAPVVTGGFTINGVEGQTFTATVATFTQAQEPLADFTATIDWGDGTTTLGTISGPDQNGVFSVTGTHAYAEETNEFHGTPTITVTVSNGTAVSVVDIPNIAEGPLSATPGAAVSAVAGQDVAAAVATFTDTGGPENATLDYTASIDWGDGTATTGTISGPDQNGVFAVTGDHTYAAGSFPINVTITHESGGGSVTVTTSATVTSPRGAASLPGQGLTGFNALPTVPVQQATTVPVMITHTPSSSRSSAASNDQYWAQYSSQGDQLIDLNAGIVDGLTLALQGTPS